MLFILGLALGGGVMAYIAKHHWNDRVKTQIFSYIGASAAILVLVLLLL